MSRLQQARAKAVELGVYLPLGAFDRAREGVTDFDAKKLRKLYGQFVDRGEDRLAPVGRRVRREARDVRRSAKGTARDVRSTAKRTTRTAQTRAKQSSRKTTAKGKAAAGQVAPKVPRVAAPKTAGELPIKGYNDLTADEIITQTRGLTQTDLAKIYKYEKANEDRATILQSIETRFVELPIPIYDALTVEEINGRLEKLDEKELRKIRSYEQDTKQRQTVLDKIESLL